MMNEEKKVCSNTVYVAEGFRPSANVPGPEYVPSGVAMARYAASLNSRRS